MPSPNVEEMMPTCYFASLIQIIWIAQGNIVIITQKD